VVEDLQGERMKKFDGTQQYARDKRRQVGRAGGWVGLEQQYARDEQRPVGGWVSRLARGWLVAGFLAGGLVAWPSVEVLRVRVGFSTLQASNGKGSLGPSP